MLISLGQLKRNVMSCIALRDSTRTTDEMTMAINAIAVAVVAHDEPVCVDLGNGQHLRCTVVANGPRSTQ